MNQEFYRQLFGKGFEVRLGEAAIRAKAFTEDEDIRKTWILFSDPTLRLK